MRTRARANRHFSIAAKWQASQRIIDCWWQTRPTVDRQRPRLLYNCLLLINKAVGYLHNSRDIIAQIQDCKRLGQNVSDMLTRYHPWRDKKLISLYLSEERICQFKYWMFKLNDLAVFVTTLEWHGRGRYGYLWSLQYSADKPKTIEL